MKKELVQKIVEKNPTLFAHKQYPVSLDCGDGWFDLLDQLCDMINWDVNNNRAPAVEITQVKEKFGTLRFYYNGGNERIDGYVGFAEQLSGITCEVCGSRGKLRGGSWMRTLCDEHAEGKEEHKWPTEEDIAKTIYIEKVKHAESLDIPCTCGFENIAANAPTSGGRHDDSCEMMK